MKPVRSGWNSFTKARNNEPKKEPPTRTFMHQKKFIMILPEGLKIP